MNDSAIKLLLCLLLQRSISTAVDPVQFGVSRGRCVVPALKQHQMMASGARMCVFQCSQLSACIAWSYRTGICNVSDSVQTHILTNLTDCEWWSSLHQLGHVAFWPMSNVSRTRNVLSDSGYLDLQENRVMQYAGDAVNFTGQFDVNERFNINALASVCLNSFTISVWVKVSNPSRGAMPLIEGLVMPSDHYTRLWLYPASSNVEFTIMSSTSRGFTDTPPVTPNAWTHITAVYDKATPTVKIFLNATRILAASVTASTLTTCAYFGSTVQIGAITRIVSHNRVFQGFMKCFGVSGRALSDKEVTQLSQLCPLSGSP